MKLYSKEEFKKLNESVFDEMGDMLKQNYEGDINVSFGPLNSLEDVEDLQNVNVLHGFLMCSNTMITDLIGSPLYVTGVYLCNNSKLTSLEGAPQTSGPFDCSHNYLKDLKGSPRIVNGDFNCSGNDLTSLEGHPDEINGSFHVRACPHITHDMLEDLKKNCKIQGKINFM